MTFSMSQQQLATITVKCGTRQFVTVCMLPFCRIEAGLPYFDKTSGKLIKTLSAAFSDSDGLWMDGKQIGQKPKT
jgi:hypothetical protein